MAHAKTPPMNAHPVPTVTARYPCRQRGVVLIVSLIMLVIISLLASFSIRNATSTEAVAGNARTAQLATQAAEAALRYCARQMDTYYANYGSATTTFALYPKPFPYADYPRASHKNAAGELDYWDGATSVAANTADAASVAPPQFPSGKKVLWIVPTTEIGGTATYRRPPECMVEPMIVINSAGTGTSTTSSYVITARGFGPEVADTDPAVRTRPRGSEVWLQSTDTN